MSALRRDVRRHGQAFLALAKSIEVACAGLGARSLYRRRYLSAARLLVREERLELPGLPAGLDGLRVAQLSDLHGGRFLKQGDLRDVVARVNAERPDVCVLTGDFISHEWSDVLPLTDDLAQLRPRLGSFAVFGNHDYKYRQEALIAEALARSGVRVLRNEGVRLDTGDGVLALTGLEDLEEAREVDLEAARSGLQPGDVELVLCHNPSAGARLAREGCAAVLSGHSHGRQVDLPLLRGFGPPHPGLRIQYGPTCQLVSRGLGVVALPLRWGSPAEVVLVELRSGGAR
jgi:predicted MPP superfamily phosphohydrolase